MPIKATLSDLDNADNERVWDVEFEEGVLTARPYDDTLVSADKLQVERSGPYVRRIILNGIEVWRRSQRSQNEGATPKEPSA
jgi:hypothetical protein